MFSLFDKYMNFFLNNKNKHNKKLATLIQKTKLSTLEFGKKSKIKLEVEKSKLELRKKYYFLGKHVSNSFLKEEKIDFSFDDKFSQIINDIKQLKDYIIKINNGKIKL